MRANGQREGFFHRIGRWLHLVKPRNAAGTVDKDAGPQPAPLEPPAWPIDMTDSMQVSAALSRVGGNTDMSHMPFRLIFEVAGTPNKLARSVQALGWNVSQPAYDCSHNTAAEVHGVRMADKHERSRTYSRVGTGELTLAGGGLEKLAQGIDALRGAGAVVGTTAAMRIYLPTAGFSDEAAARMLNLHRSYDDLIYRMAAGCGGGRTVEHKSYFARPTCLNLESAPAQSGSAGRIWKGGVNQYDPGYWEFRYFDATTLGAAAGAHVALALSLAKAALEGRGDVSQIAPHSNNKDNIFNTPVQNDRMEAFLDVVAGPTALRDVYRDQFKRGGGALASP
jgi:hypothetical protein